MVYEKKCAECGRLIDFGGKESGELPEDAIEFNGEIYCRDCVKKFVEFGTGGFEKRFEYIEQAIEEIQQELGMEKGLNM